MKKKIIIIGSIVLVVIIILITILILNNHSTFSLDNKKDGSIVVNLKMLIIKQVE